MIHGHSLPTASQQFCVTFVKSVAYVYILTKTLTKIKSLTMPILGGGLKNHPRNPRLIVYARISLFETQRTGLQTDAINVQHAPTKQHLESYESLWFV